jgi:hypothetical protein
VHEVDQAVHTHTGSHAQKREDNVAQSLSMCKWLSAAGSWVFGLLPQGLSANMPE